MNKKNNQLPLTEKRFEKLLKVQKEISKRKRSKVKEVKPLTRHDLNLTRSEFIVAKAPIEVLIPEFNSIKNKSSNLSKAFRDAIELRIEFLQLHGEVEFDSEGYVIE